jgi:hypothetical protein
VSGAFAGDVDECEGGGGMEGGESCRGGERVVVGYFEVFAVVELALEKCVA